MGGRRGRRERVWFLCLFFRKIHMQIIYPLGLGEGGWGIGDKRSGNEERAPLHQSHTKCKPAAPPPRSKQLSGSGAGRVPASGTRSAVSLMGCTGKAARGTRSHGNPHFGDSRVPSSCSRRAKERVGTRIGTCWAAQLGLQPCRQKWEQQPLWFVSLLFPCLCMYVCLFVR